MTSPHAIYRRTDLLPTGSGTTVLFSTIGGPKVRGIAAWLTLVIEHSHLGTVNLYWTNDGGTNWYLADTEEFVPGAESSQREFFVEPYSDIKLEWVNGGTNQTTFQLTMSISQQRGGGASGASDLSQAALWDTALYATAYGADPTGVADSTETLQAWLDATADTGRMGRIPAGDYRISDSLYVNGTGGAILGDGRHLTRLFWDGATNDGKAMMVWSRQQGALEGISLDGDSKATHAFVLHNGTGSKLGFHARLTYLDAVLCHGLWEGLDEGFNEVVVFDQVTVDNCGYLAIHLVRINGTGLGGTFTLTVNGDTTPPLAYNATAATVAAALLALDTVAYTNANGTSGWYGSASYTPQSDPGLLLQPVGILAGTTPVITADFSGITGSDIVTSITVSQTARPASGFKMLDTAVAGADFGTLRFFHCEAKGCSQHGINVVGQGIIVDGGHFEGNGGAGVYMGTTTGSATAGCIATNVWCEANWHGGIVAEPTVGQTSRNMAIPIDGTQPVENTGTITHYSFNDGRLAVVDKRFQQTTSDAICQLYGAALFSITGAGARHAMNVDNLAESNVTAYAHSVAGPLVVDCKDYARIVIILNANINGGGLQLTNIQLNAPLQIMLFHGAAGPYTVAWGATVKWIGAAAPVLGSGGANSVDTIHLEYNAVGGILHMGSALGQK